ncbi:MAG: DUF6036 family nucleotidyltransferase [Gemmatimonadota bacterium]
MNRAQFEHAIRAAGAILDRDEVLVLGSQAIHASISGPLPAEAERSIEVDIAVFGDDDGGRADLIDGAIGEASMFHATFGYYAQGVVESTATLPDGWRERLVSFSTPATEGVTARCLEPHDLWISKAIAYRPKDLEFCRALRRDGLVEPRVLFERLAAVPDLPEARRQLVERLVAEANPGEEASR